LELELANTGWLKELTPCPKKICINKKTKTATNPKEEIWKAPGRANPEHGGAFYEMRSKPTLGGHANQCCYNEDGLIMTGIPAGGTADYVSHGLGTGHFLHDLRPWWLAKKLYSAHDYYKVRPVVVE
jgi:hypothetical protein